MTEGCSAGVSEWELSKENIQPLKQGRKPTVLSQALDEHTHKIVAQHKQEFECAIRTYAGDDPLDVWYQYVLWTEQNFPKGGNGGNLFKLIQSCIANMTGSGLTEKYKADWRMLDLWIKYASFTPNPLEVYSSLSVKKLFLDLAEFYVNWAWEMEKTGNFKNTNAIYEKGFQQTAQPLEKLEASYSQFQMRVARQIAEGFQREEEEPVGEQREALASLKVRGTKARAPITRVGSNVVGGAGVLQTQNPSLNSRTPKFPIFQGTENAQPISIYEDILISGASSVVVHDQAAANKENSRCPSQWTKNKLKSKVVPVISVDDVNRYRSPDFVVHRDPDDDVKAAPQPVSINIVLQPCKDDFTDWAVPLFLAEPFNPFAQPQYCKHKVYCGTEEFSLEELRAARYFARMKEGKSLQDELDEARQALKRQQDIIRKLLQAKVGRKCEMATSTAAIYEDSWCAVNNSTTSRSHVIQDAPAVSDERIPKDCVSEENLKAVSLAPAAEGKTYEQVNRNNVSGAYIGSTPTKDYYNMVNNLFDGSLKSVLLEKTADRESGPDQSQAPQLEGFQIYVDPSSVVQAPLNMKPSSICKRDFNAITLPNVSADKDQDMEKNSHKENIPPSEYCKKNEKRIFGGILQPSKDFPFAPLAEPVNTKCENQGLDDLDRIEPMVPPNCAADFTIKLPNPETFNKQLCVASTPMPFSRGFVPEGVRKDEDDTMKCPVACQEKAETTFAQHVQDCTSDDSKGPVPLDPVQLSSSEFRVHKMATNGQAAYIPKPSNLSIIFEASQEKKSYSSSSSSSSSTTAYSSHLVSSGFIHSAVSRKHQVSGSQIYPDAADDGDTFSPDAIAAQLLNLQMIATAPKPPTDTVVPESSNVQSVISGEHENLFCKKVCYPDEIDPFDANLNKTLLSALSYPVEKRPGFVQIPDKLPLLKPGIQVPLGKEHYNIKKLRGTGAYASIYQASTVDPMNVTVLPSCHSSDEDEEAKMVLKVQKPMCVWEFYICSELRKRLKKNGASVHILEAVMRINRGYFFDCGSILVSQFHNHGTLLDLVNGFRKANKAISESVTMILAIHLLRIVDAMHSCGIIHADVKPDNLLIMDPLSVCNGTVDEYIDCNQDVPLLLKIIDFGRSIDMKLLPPGSKFTYKVTTEGFSCCEMRDGNPWTYQTDLFGIAACIHMLLWGSYMKIKKTNGIYKPTGVTMQRQWSSVMWTKVFDTLLNVPSCEEVPNLVKIGEQIQKVLRTKYREEERYSQLKSYIAMLSQLCTR